MMDLIEQCMSGDLQGRVFLAFISITVLLVAHRVLKVIKSFRFFRSLPQEENFSYIWGNLQNFPTDNESFIAYTISKMHHLHPKLFCAWIGPLKPIIIVYHPDTVRAVLKSSAPKSRGFAKTYDFLVPWIGEGLVASNGSVWQRSRHLLTPAFHFDILKHYIDINNQAADKLLEKLESFVAAGKELDVYRLLHLCTLEVILKCAFSYDLDVQLKGHNPYAEATRKLNEIFTKRLREPWYWPTCIFKLCTKGRIFFQSCKYVHSVADKVIHKRKTELEARNGPHPDKGKLDFIDILLRARDEEGKPMTNLLRARDEEGKPMTNLEIRNEVDTVMFAGHDTTATCTMWFLYCLAKYPEYQIKIQEEVDALLEGKNSDNIQWSNLSELPMLSLCLKETMRLYPPVPFIERELMEETVIDGHVIPPGTTIGVSILLLHRNPAVWKDQNEFKPERFTYGKTKGRDTFSYVPFSAGPRNCIGQNFAVNEVKVLISRMMRKYTVELVPSRPEPIRFPLTTLQSENGMWLRFKSRT